MKICGLLMSMYDGSPETLEKLERSFGADTVAECLARNYIETAGVNHLNLSQYQITLTGKSAFDNRTY